MGLRRSIDHLIGQLINELPVQGRSVQDLVGHFQGSKTAILEHAQKVGDSEYNRRVLSHIIGIERWGQSRLRVFLGEPLVLDEYNAYRPAREATWPVLLQGFADTRDETIRLAQQLASDSLAVPTVLHNQFGPLTAKGWLQYLSAHASRERYGIH